MRYNTIDIPKETLERLYWDERLSIDSIAKHLGVSVTPVYRSMERHNVRRRTEAQIGQLERARMGISKEMLEELYLSQQLPITIISMHLKRGTKTISGMLVDYGIPTRTQTEVNKLSASKRLRDKDGHGRNWRGGRIKTKVGYVLRHRPEHPRANLGGYVYEHILVWEETYGKKLPKGWVVHHLNGIKDDNRPQNLVAMLNGEHIGLAKPYKARIRQLETELRELQQLKLTPSYS